MPVYDRYFDFDVNFRRIGTRSFTAQVLSSPAGETSHDFDTPIGDVELLSLPLRIGLPKQATRRKLDDAEQALRDYGTRLFDAALGGQNRACYRRSLTIAEAQDSGLRIRLRLGEAARLSELPWEYLFDHEVDRFVALQARTPVVRYLELPEAPRALTFAPPIRVLVMVAEPLDQPILDVEQEWSRLTSAFHNLQECGLVSLHRLASPTLPELQRELRQRPYHIFHFVGHGAFDESRMDGVLLFEDDQRRDRPVTGEQLGTLLYNRPEVRLVFLNSCDGARTSRQDMFSGVAQTLVRFGIPAVVAMQFPISDRAAIASAHEFYRALADGYQVDAALTEARVLVRNNVNIAEWGTPVLHLRAPDARIFEIAQQLSGSQGGERGQLILRAERLLEEGDARGALRLLRDAETIAAGIGDPIFEQLKRRARLAELRILAREQATIRSWINVATIRREISELDPSDENNNAALHDAEKQHLLQSRHAEVRQARRVGDWAEMSAADWEVVIEKLNAVLDVDASDVTALAELREAKKQCAVATLQSELATVIGCRDWSRAITVLRRLLEVDPSHPDARTQLRHMERLREIDSLRSAAHVALANGDLADALQKFQRLCVLTPDDARAKQALEETRSALDAERLRRERLAALERLRREADRAINASEWMNVIGVLQQLLVLRPDDEIARRQLKRAEESHEEKVRQVRAQQAIRRRDWKSVVAAIDDAVGPKPVERDVTRMADHPQLRTRVALRRVGLTLWQVGLGGALLTLLAVVVVTRSASVSRRGTAPERQASSSVPAVESSRTRADGPGAEAYRLAELLVGSNPVAARGYYLEAAKLGNVDAQYRLAVVCDQLGLTAEAEEWRRRAAEGGSSDAQNDIGAMLIARSHGSSDPMWQRGVEWLERAATSGDTLAQYRLGVALREGARTEADVTAAVSWLSRAADADSTEAQLALGRELLTHSESAEDLAQAARLIRRAAEAGFGPAETALGRLCEDGRPVAQDYRAAAEWYYKAAQRGDAEGAYRLGLLLARGRGVDADKFAAEKWWRRAASAGHKAAQQALRESQRGGSGVDRER